MERLKREPGGWGVALGGAIAMVSIFFAWVSVTNPSAHDATWKTGLFHTVTGQTIGFLGLLAIIAGLGLVASSGGGRIWWALLALLGTGTVLVAALIAIFSPATFAAWIATTQTISTLAITQHQESINATVTSNLDSGAITAAVAFGAFIGLAAGLLGVAGSVLGFRKKRPSSD
jgi:hypothetical protein